MTIPRSAWFRLNRLRTFPVLLVQMGYVLLCDLWVWRRKTNRRPCCPPMSNPSTFSWTARPDGSGRWNNWMAAQHLPRGLVRPCNGLKNWVKRWRIRPSSHCIAAEKFVSVSGELNHNCSPLLLDSNKLVCHVNTPLLKVYELDRQSEGSRRGCRWTPGPGQLEYYDHRKLNLCCLKGYSFPKGSKWGGHCSPLFYILISAN